MSGHKLKRVNSKRWKRHRDFVHNRDDYTCYLCGMKMYKDHPLLTVDHIISPVFGGTNANSNLRTACKDCNQKTGRAHRLRNFIEIPKF